MKVLPLWIHRNINVFLRRDATKARQAGLRYRTIETTLLDTREWLKEFPQIDLKRMTLPSDIIRKIEYFGSTAIPGLSAKPIIDILVEVSSLEETKKQVVPLLTENGYEYYWRPTIGNAPPYYAWFIKRDNNGIRTHHIHMVEAASELWDRLWFRDYLCEFPGEAARYEVLKTNLSRINANDRTAYTSGKTDYVVSVTKKQNSITELIRAFP